MHPTSESVLFVTLDSCRYDTFIAADVPRLKAVGPLHCALAPSHFTYGSHAAMFMGFTPGVPGLARPYVDPKFARLFKMVGGGSSGKGGEAYQLTGGNVIQGFKAIGFEAVGASSVGWFNPGVPTGEALTRDFDHFFFSPVRWSAEEQVAWLEERIAARRSEHVFAFLNAGETHVPYFHKGAAWSPKDNPCRPYQTVDRAADCGIRQRACLEHLDRVLAPLVERFAQSTILLCADHGDCWGEDGLWEHGISHPKTLTVPLLMRVRGTPIA
jgi:hypothetical protein